MPRTPDEFPGSRVEEELLLEQTGSIGTVTGSVRYVGSEFVMVDGEGAFNPRGSGSLNHKSLRHLIHFIDEGPGDGLTAGGAVKETLPLGSFFPTSITWYEDDAKTVKIFQKVIVRSGSIVAPTPIIYRMFESDGVTISAWAQDDITYYGIIETTRSRSFGP